MEIYKSKHWTILYDSEKELITTIWNKLSFHMTDEIYQNEMLNYAQMVEKYKPLRLLVDSHYFEFVISPVMQEWTNNTIFPRVLAAGLKRVAITVPPNIITQLSLEQTMSEPTGNNFITRYFGNRGDAVQWLIS